MIFLGLWRPFVNGCELGYLRRVVLPIEVGMFPVKGIGL